MSDELKPGVMAMPAARATHASHRAAARLGLSVGIAIALVGCSPEKADDPLAPIGSEAAQKKASGEWIRHEYYPQPDFEHERVFKAEDQFGCKWWLTSGHKFDDSYIALRDDGRPDCKDPARAPAKTVGWRDKDGNWYRD